MAALDITEARFWLVSCEISDMVYAAISIFIMASYVWCCIITIFNPPKTVSPSSDTHKSEIPVVSLEVVEMVQTWLTLELF